MQSPSHSIEVFKKLLGKVIKYYLKIILTLELKGKDYQKEESGETEEGTDRTLYVSFIDSK